VSERTQSADILVVAATSDENRVVREVEADWTYNDALHCSVREDSYGIRWALAQPVDMGVEATATLASDLVARLRPRCLAMVGVCAGCPGKTRLGDVVVASRLFRYDVGKLRRGIVEGKPTEDVFHDIQTYNLDSRWYREIDRFEWDWSSHSFHFPRPKPMAEQEAWLLAQIGSDGSTVSVLEERDEYCPDWTAVVDRLLEREWIVRRGQKLFRTKEGDDELDALRVRYPNALPREVPHPDVHLAPMATGSKVIEDSSLFATIHKYVRKALAVDMEASAIGHIAEHAKVEHSIVVKGVQDFATPEKDDRYREYAAEAAYRVLSSILPRLLRTGADDVSGSNDYSIDHRRMDDILSTVFNRRRRIVSDDKGTDFSSGRRIKFELWLVENPKPEHVLILYPHINLGQTMQRFMELSVDCGEEVRSLTILRIGNKTKSRAAPREITEQLGGIALSYFLLQDFIRDFGIDRRLVQKREVWEEPYYVDQPVYLDTEPPEKIHDRALLYLDDQLSAGGHSAAILVHAEGGDGKSSLSYALVNRINRKSDEDGQCAILLRIDEIREDLSGDRVRNHRVSSLYDIYELFSITKGEIYPRVSRAEFEVAVLSGNLIVVVDGLDELFTVFQDDFDREHFVQSLELLHKQLGEARVVLTSRGNVLKDILEQGGSPVLSVLRLRGFSSSECDRYFRTRFRREEDSGESVRVCLSRVGSLLSLAGVDRLSPFVVDLVAHEYEAAAPSQRGEDQSDGDWAGPGDNYPNSDSLTDRVVFNYLKRERDRQRTEVSPAALVELLTEIAADHGPTVSRVKFEDIVDIYFEKQAATVLAQLLVNPLLRAQGEAIAFRYNFLYGYFLALYVMRAIAESAGGVNPVRLPVFSRLAEGRDAVYRDVLSYVRTRKSVIDYAGTFQALRARLQEEPRAAARAISFFAHLFVDQNEGASNREVSQALLEFFRDARRAATVSDLHIVGSLIPLDFSGLDVLHSSFRDFREFLRSNFKGAHFSGCEIEMELEGVQMPGSVTSDTFDDTCRIGALSEYVKHGVTVNAGMRERILRRFFREFLQGNAFVERRVAELRFGMNAREGEFPRYFREGCRQHVLYRSEDGARCGVSQPGRRLVANFLNNGRLDRKLRKIMDCIEVQDMGHGSEYSR
jgi:nucleoside phosphorylase